MAGYYGSADARAELGGKMAKGFQRGCPLPMELKDEVKRNSSSRPHHGTCRTCEKLGQKTQYYRDQPCPFMKGVGKYGWRGMP